ncbi:hypothetical protein BDV11DRAFT_168433 [Aspergillus similis]
MPSDNRSTQKRRADFHELQSALACIWVPLPARVHSVSEALPARAAQSPGSDQYPTERENFTCTQYPRIREHANKVVTTRTWRRSQQQEFRLDLGLVLRLLEPMAMNRRVMPKIYKEIIEQELEEI